MLWSRTRFISSLMYANMLIITSGMIKSVLIGCLKMKIQTPKCCRISIILLWPSELPELPKTFNYLCFLLVFFFCYFAINLPPFPRRLSTILNPISDNFIKQTENLFQKNMDILLPFLSLLLFCSKLSLRIVLSYIK